MPETKKKSVKPASPLATKYPLGSFKYERARDRQREGKLKDYMRATYRNAQGKREEVLLVDTNEECDFTEGMLSRDSFPELRYDLTKAFGMFTLSEQTVLYRVLVQGQSIVQATKRMKSRSRRSWARWYADKALTKLRRVLKDYKRGERVVV